LNHAFLLARARPAARADDPRPKHGHHAYSAAVSARFFRERVSIADARILPFGCGMVRIVLHLDGFGSCEEFGWCALESVLVASRFFFSLGYHGSPLSGV
jgi:hypothetical protein